MEPKEIKIFQIYRMLQDLVVGSVSVETKCPHCGKEHAVPMTKIYSMVDDMAEDPSERESIKARLESAFKVKLIP
jgi:hypothetical protein